MSGSGSRLTRLLALVPWLIANDGVTIDDAATHFGITPKQLEADLWLLVVSGLPGYGPDHLVDIQFWDDGRIHVLDPQTIDAPLRLSTDEAITLLIGLRALANVDRDNPAISTATAKLEHATGVALGPDVVVTADVGDVIDDIERAIREGCACEISYAGASTDEVSTRVIEPARLALAQGHAYVEAWCRTAEGPRTFRLDRIVSCRVLADPVADRPSGSALDWARPIDVVMIVTPEAAWVADTYDVSDVQERSDGSLQVTLPVADERWAARLVLSLGGSAVVVEPASVAQAVVKRAEAALKAYA